MQRDKPKKSGNRLNSNTAATITFFYLALSLIWIAISGQVAEFFSSSQETLAQIELYKGIGFILATSVLLYTFINGSILALESREDRIWRLNRIYAMLSGINSAILRIRDKQELLGAACRIAADGGIYQAVGIRLVDKDKNTVKTVASGGVFQDFVNQTKVSLSADDQYGHGPTGTALREGRTIVINDVNKDPRSEPWRKESTACGIQSSAAFPLMVNNQIIGAISLYSQEANAFDEEEIRLLNEIAADTSLGLEYIEKEYQLDYLHYHDIVTALPNRTLLEDRLNQSILRFGFHPERLTAVMALTIENFRRITDAFGVHTGDMILREVSSYIKNTLRPGDFVAKIGAYDFGVLLADLAADRDISVVSHKLFSTLPRIIHVDDHDVSLVYRAGIAVHPRDSHETNELIRYAGHALSAAGAEKATIHYFSRAMETRFEKINDIEQRLQFAIENNELRSFFQPIVRVATRHMVSVEALLRWHNPQLGSVPPVEFIPVAEEAGLIIPIGYWMIEAAGRQLKIWAEDGLEIRVAVNVSPRQLREQGFADRVLNILNSIGIDLTRHKMSIEITESDLMESIDKILPEFNILKNAGVGISVDDFGTGYSSLSYLRKLPVDTLKIDREFINGLPHIKESVTLVKGIIGMAKGLGLKVVAEGVETEEQFAILQDLECDFVQGYLFSKPVPADELENHYLATKNTIS